MAGRYYFSVQSVNKPFPYPPYMLKTLSAAYPDVFTGKLIVDIGMEPLCPAGKEKL